MARRQSKEWRSLLDRMEEIAEEQAAEERRRDNNNFDYEDEDEDDDDDDDDSHEILHDSDDGPLLFIDDDTGEEGEEDDDQERVLGLRASGEHHGLVVRSTQLGLHPLYEDSEEATEDISSSERDRAYQMMMYGDMNDSNSSSIQMEGDNNFLDPTAGGGDDVNRTSLPRRSWQMERESGTFLEEETVAAGPSQRQSSQMILDGSILSVSSAPVFLSSNEDILYEDGGGTDNALESSPSSSPPTRRRVTISGPSQGQHNEGEDTVGNLRASSRRFRGSQRRSNFYRQSIQTSEVSETTQDTSIFSSGAGINSPMSDSSLRFSRTVRSALGGPRRSSRRTSTRAPGSSIAGTSSSSASSSTLMAAAVNRLGSSDQNSEWENTAAAAAVVAASAAAPSNRGHTQFAQGDEVLVMLTLLNITNNGDSKEMYTVDPVNAHGYPRGEGKSDAQKHGPFSFVICTVTKVHFDEDERYYTVRRGDTGSEQRADPGWMEPIRDEAALEMAYQAARRTRISASETKSREAERRGGVVHVVSESFTGFLSWPSHFLQRLVPFYRHTRAATKMMVAHLMNGDTGYACRMRTTAINILVLCSFIYLFLDVVALAFLPASVDYTVACLGLAVWVILALELLFEFIIRPGDYSELQKSEKAFAPSTARHINLFHLVCETLSLLLFTPTMACLVNSDRCGELSTTAGLYASLAAVVGTSDDKRDNRIQAFGGRLVLGLTFLRAFGLVRHWKQMWINHTFEGDINNSRVLRKLLLVNRELASQDNHNLTQSQRAEEMEFALGEMKTSMNPNARASYDEDDHLKNAATIGTALMIVNSHRALTLLLLIVAVFPSFHSLGVQNSAEINLLHLLQENNIAASSLNPTDQCDYLAEATDAWLFTAGAKHFSTNFLLVDADSVLLLWAQMLPTRCEWQRKDGVITYCPNTTQSAESEACQVWDSGVSPKLASREHFAELLDLRTGAVREYKSSETLLIGDEPTEFSVRIIVDRTHTVAFVNAAFCMLLLLILILCLVGLTVMRHDAGRLVLNPLRRMLKIVVRYAENPLSQSLSFGKRKISGDQNKNDLTKRRDDSEELGNYETEQLINAIAKIADLLRKCWGVAGAGIISSNLARTKDGKTVVFNPTIPGKRVYALFGFVAINDFSKELRDLESDVMILINDVARVVHDEVYRWALGDSGQCNKNLGSAFLMVFRIGDFREVHDKQKRATNVVFNAQMKGRNVKLRRRRKSQMSGRARGEIRRSGGRRSSKQFDLGTDGTLQLASLPGIQSFTDRALLGFLKSFAGIHRDRNLQNWTKDFRLGAGVGAFTVSVRYGMDAGWAVEGAVGSEYKIDATYLSPHVNMASRMMSATKQYGVTILLSQAVEELLSKPARQKLRHLDTVYVKGSNVAQRIFTYDARYEGVDFFLFDRSPDQADIEAENYTPNMWELDQDLRSMRQHVTENFMSAFKRGVGQYLDGKWNKAVESLTAADDLMIQAVLEEGYIEYDDDDYSKIFDRGNTTEDIARIRNEFGDGACKCLIQYMQRRNNKPPPDWRGVRTLMSK